VPVTASRLEVLAAANQAAAGGDAATAADLYQRVVNTPPSQTENAQLSMAIDSFARFRALVTLLASGREADARRQLDALQQRDPSAPFARLAAQLWDQYGMIGQLQPACAQLRPSVASQAGPTLAVLQAAGLSVDPSSVC
jgi:hypothetical protein